MGSKTTPPTRRPFTDRRNHAGAIVSREAVLSLGELGVRGKWGWACLSPGRLRTCGCGRFSHDVDDTQAELALGPVHEVQLQPAGNARGQRADDEDVVARVQT